MDVKSLRIGSVIIGIIAAIAAVCVFMFGNSTYEIEITILLVIAAAVSVSIAIMKRINRLLFAEEYIRYLLAYTLLQVAVITVCCIYLSIYDAVPYLVLSSLCMTYFSISKASFYAGYRMFVKNRCICAFAVALVITAILLIILEDYNAIRALIPAAAFLMMGVTIEECSFCRTKRDFVWNPPVDTEESQIEEE